MTTSKKIDLSLSAQALISGADQISSDSIRFASTLNRLIPCGSQMFAKRLKFADMVFVDPGYTWNIVRGATTPMKINGSVIARDLSGEPLDNLQYVNFVYISCNADIEVIYTPFSTPSSLPADSSFFIGGQTDFFAGASATSGFIYLTFGDSVIEDVGIDKFYCDIIIA